MPNPVSLRSVVTVAPQQVSCDLANEAAILSLTSGTYYGLNEVGGRIWSLIRDPVAVQRVLDQLLVEYDVDPVRCERDVLALLQQLAEEGLIEVSDA